ncbi:MAG: primosomal protein N' [bacterium]|nr:primosomal protein N' [bacterium]
MSKADQSWNKVDVAVDLHLEGNFTYLLPEAMAADAAIGRRVLVPFGRRKLTGYILGKSSVEGIERLKEAEAWLDKGPLFDEKMLKFFRWISTYYQSPLGEVIKAALPAGINSASFKLVKLSEEWSGSLSDLSASEEKVVSFLKNSGEIPLSTFKKSFASSKDLSLLYRLENKGVLSLTTEIKEGRTREKSRKFVSAPKALAETERVISKRAGEIVAFIHERGELELTVIINELSTTHSTLNRLKEAGLINIFEKSVFRDPFRMPTEKADVPLLNFHQSAVIEEIEKKLAKGGYAPFLLEGKTGSGKTEVYLRTIEKTGGNAIVLIPEISLTPQLTSRFRERFGERVAVLHSGLSPGERFDQWRKINEGICDIVVGARSAIFAPLKGLKAIIVDEEHEPSYKQEDGIRYNARDVALVRGKIEGAIVILGSATPSLESMRNRAEGKLGSLILPERVGNILLPEIDIVDMRKYKKKDWISPKLKEMIAETLEKGEQALIFLNRRGYTPFVICPDCGQDFRCPNCSVSLTWHQSKGELTCHYCDYTIDAMPVCPNCSSLKVKGVGIGTERLEAELLEMFEGVKIARMDRDTVKGRGEIEKLLHSFGKGDQDILIGTQMVAKGHHFPGVTLVGVVLADLSLNVPDFRAAERTFQLLTQVAGRAGRSGKRGKVAIQTFNPDHYSILHGGEKDGEVFYAKEMEMREALSFPPFARLVNFRISGRDEMRVTKGASMLKNSALRILKNMGSSGIDILGPAPAPLARLKGMTRWHMLARSKETAPLHRFSQELMAAIKNGGSNLNGLTIIPDFDPYNMM